MSKSLPYARIAITIPQEDLAAAERLAKAQDRSRSWIVAEAVRQYVATSALGASRTLQLQRDMALTPEQRVRIAEETLALQVPAADSAPRASRGFDSYEEFLDWKRDRNVVP